MAELARSNLQTYSPEKTKKWLSRLARGMIAHNQTIFMIERLQPSWLPIIFLQWIYLLISRVTIIILVGCSVLIYIGAHFLLKILVASVIMGFIISVGEIAYVWLFSHIDMQKHGCLNTLIVLLSYPMLVLITEFTNVAVFPQILGDYSRGVFLWTIQILVFFGFRSALIGLNQDLKAVEGISFSFKRMIKGAFFSLIPVFSIIAITLLESSYKPLVWLLSGSFISLSVVIALFCGLNKTVHDIGNYPNQGLKLSIRNALLVFGLIVLLVFISGAIYIVLLTIQFLIGTPLTPIVAFINGFLMLVFFGPILGFFGILFFGGNFVVKHFTLRCLLSLFGYLPWNLARFLDYCVDLNFLQKVGGGYMFIHKYVMEHFAEIQP